MNSRSDFVSQFDWLSYLQNRLGDNTLEIACSGKTKEGTVWFSKRYSFFYLQHLNPYDLIPLDNANKNKKSVSWFINNATHRSILDFEIVADIDDKGDFNSILEKTKDIIKNLKTKYPDINFRVYFTGSKSYHIHIFEPELRGISQADELKKIFLNDVGADGLKIGRNLIALEGALHYKSGKPKAEVFL